RLSYQNTHSAPLGYEMESLRLRIRDGDPWTDAFGDALQKEGIVAAGQREAFTLAPFGPFQRDDAPTHVAIVFAMRYGPIVDQGRAALVWREERGLVATLAFPIMQRESVSIPFTWQGQ